MENLSSVITSVFLVTRLLYFRLTCFVYDFHFGGNSKGGGMLSVIYVSGILIFSAHHFFFNLFNWYPQTSWLDTADNIIVLLIMQYAMITLAENQWRWILRERKILRAVCDDVSAFKAWALKADMSHHLLDSDLLSLQPIEEEWIDSTKLILPKIESLEFSLSRKVDFLRKQKLFFQFFIIDLMKNDVSKHLGRLDKSSINIYGSLDRSMSMIRRLQHIAEQDDDGSASVDKLAATVSSVRNKVKDFIKCQQEYPNLTRYMLRPIQQVEWKMMFLEAFLKDLVHVKLEHAVQKAWIEEAQALMGDLDVAIDTFSQRMGNNGMSWFFNPGCLLAWPWLSQEIDWVADGLDSVCKQMHRYGFKFIRRQHQAQPYQKDIAVINKVQSLLNKICHELNQEQVTSSKVLREITYLSNLLEKMHKLLESVKAIEGASNFRTFCISQMQDITKSAENAIESCRRSSDWLKLSQETNLIEPFLNNLDTSIKAYGIEQRRNSIMGLEEDTDALVSQLITGTQQSNIFSIVGMQGTGKTTLANKVYHHKAIWSHFPRRAWVSLPQASNDVDALLQDVGKQIMGISEEEGSGKEYWDQKIQSFLQEERYLVVLDNISTRKVWDMVKDAFPRRNSSRLLLTCRCKTVALHADQNNPPYQLRLRTKEETWVSFKEKAQLRPDRLSQEMVIKVKEGVARCGGLPLTISSLGFLMSGRTPNDRELSRVLAQINQHRNLWLESFSDIDLPQHLKALLAYFTLFPKNFEIPVRRLIALWVAEGVEQQNADGEITLENIAEKYLLELISLDIIQPVEIHVNGKVKKCCLPDSLWDVVLAMSASSSRQRLVDHGDSNYASFKFIHGGGGGKPRPAEWQRYKNLLSLISFDSRDGNKAGEDIGKFVSRGIANGCFRQLRVLDLEHVFRPQLPNTIGNMVELRYLGLRWTYLEEIPTTIGNLMNLQTLDLKHTYIRTLPPTIWKLQKLHHLYLNHTHRSKFVRQSKTRLMQNLQTLWGLFLDKNSPLRDTLDELKSLRKLKTAFQLSKGDQQQLAKRVVKLQHLQTLRLSSIDVMGEPQELYLEDYTRLNNLSDMYLFGGLESVSVLGKLPQSLSDLTLSASRLLHDPMPILEMLPNLKSLSLFSDSYLGQRMVCSSKMFPKLLVLKLLKLSGLTEWIIEREAMNNLKKLEIRSCQQLKVPHGLKHLKTLNELKLRHMEEDFTATITKNRRLIWDNVIPYIICE